MDADHDLLVVFYFEAVLDAYLGDRSSVVEDLPLQVTFVLLAHTVYLQVLALKSRTRLYSHTDGVQLFTHFVLAPQRQIALLFTPIVPPLSLILASVRLHPQLTMQKV